MKIKDHMDITDYAVDLYWMFSPTELAEEFKRNAGKIRDGASLIKSGNFQQGARTLHFFNHKNRFKPKKIKLFGSMPVYTVYPTSEHSLRSYVRELRQDISQGFSNNSYILIGKILHLIQDMSSPANVIPVYHRSNRSDSFETGLNSRVGSYLSNFNFNQERFNMVSECSVGVDCIESVYQNAALRTLERINSSNSEFNVVINGEPRKVGWDLFWKSDEHAASSFYRDRISRKKGFGYYGPLGKHFGQEQVKVSKNNYVVNKEIYDDLCSFILKKSIEDSLRVLICIDNQIKSA